MPISADDIEFPDGSSLKDFLDAITGINGTSFTIDADNAGAGVDTHLRFGRGATGDAQLMWDESEARFELQSVTGTLADLKIDRLILGNNSVYIKRNSTTGDLEFHTASSDNFVFYSR